MTGIQKLKHFALLRAQHFLNEHAVALAEVNRSFARKQLDLALTRIERHAAMQDAMRTRSASLADKKADLREDLRVNHMQPLVPIAEMKGGSDPRWMAKFAMPWKRLSDAALVSQARGMAKEAEKHPDRFLDERLPATFVEELRAAATEVERARIEGDGSRAKLRVATKGIEVELDRGRRARNVLNSLVVRKLDLHLDLHHDLLVGWNSARRVRKKPGRKRRPRTATTER